LGRAAHEREVIPARDALVAVVVVEADAEEVGFA
jgi:hypothetical protein